MRMNWTVAGKWQIWISTLARYEWNLERFSRMGMMCLSDGSLKFITSDAGHRAGVRQLLACTDTVVGKGPLTNDPVKAASVLALVLVPFFPAAPKSPVARCMIDRFMKTNYCFFLRKKGTALPVRFQRVCSWDWVILVNSRFTFRFESRKFIQ